MLAAGAWTESSRSNCTSRFRSRPSAATTRSSRPRRQHAALALSPGEGIHGLPHRRGDSRRRTVELAGLAAPPNYRRAQVLAKRAKELLPDLQTEVKSEWMGHRPALPDTIPIISRSARHANVFYATGHGHLGVTLAATTARLMADLVTDVTPPLDMTPYRVDRF